MIRSRTVKKISRMTFDVDKLYNSEIKLKCIGYSQKHINKDSTNIEKTSTRIRRKTDICEQGSTVKLQSMHRCTS